MSGQAGRKPAASEPGVVAALRGKARRENFPVATLLIPPSYRRDLLNLYAFARRVDDIGDEATGDRHFQLDLITRDLDQLFAGGRPNDPALRDLPGTVSSCGLRRQPFDRLVAANRQDQAVSRYRTFDELVEYCTLSANPVGELVLGVFGVDTEQRRRYSDAICTALQLLEHCQDVAEDFAAGRIYLPAEDLEYFGVAEDELGQAGAGRGLRALLAFQVQRAIRMLDEGAALIGTLRGVALVAVSGYIAGGRATATALARSGFDVLAHSARPGRGSTAVEWIRLLGGGSAR